MDINHPFYRPLWRRIAIVAISGIWCLFDLVYTQNHFWAVLWGGLFAYSLWIFIVKFPREGKG